MKKRVRRWLACLARHLEEGVRGAPLSVRLTARPAINLLPWREVERARRFRATVGALAGALLAGVLLVWAVGWSLERQAEAQERRNRTVEGDIALIDSRIEQARVWRARRQELLQRMDVVRRLHNGRPGTVRVLDELSSALVDGTHYGRVERRGQVLQVEGFAASNHLVPALLRSLENSPQFQSAQLERLRDDSQGEAYGPRGSTFAMTLRQPLPAAPKAAGAAEGSDVRAAHVGE